MLGILVPEVERAVATGGAESAVNGMEGDGVHGKDFGRVGVAGGVFAVAFERKVGTMAGMLVRVSM